MTACAASEQELAKYVVTPSEFPDETPMPGDLIRMHYVGTLEDGTVFDSSRARGQPFQFHLGESEVIDGWDMLVGTMALGERATLVVPPEYAYGEAGVPPQVPPGATLTYDVELLDIGRPVDGEGASDEAEDEAEEEEDAATDEVAGSEGGAFWEKDPERESGKGPGYSWEATGTGAEVCISVPLSGDVKVKEIKVDVRTHSMTCKIGGKLMLDGELFAGVDSDDSHWDLERKGQGIQLLIYLAKLDTAMKWDSLFKGGDPSLPEPLAAEVVDIDAALQAANEQSRRRTDAGLR